MPIKNRSLGQILEHFIKMFDRRYLGDEEIFFQPIKSFVKHILFLISCNISPQETLSNLTLVCLRKKGTISVSQKKHDFS